MNAMLNIQIRVSSAAARQQIAALSGAMRQAQAAANSVGSGKMGGLSGIANRFGLSGTAAMTFAGKVDRMGSSLGKAFAAFPRWNKHIEGLGKNMQWVGRQLEFNFTLPLVYAGYQATKWALQNEKASIQVKKVYGDLSFSQERINSETAALSKSFELLSNRFGVNQKEVIDVAAAWASAGSAGRGLAENTRATMEAMIIGDMEAAEATEALISIMSAYRISSKKGADGTSELGAVLADLNIIENQTSIRFSGLIDVLQRAGGSAAQAGVDIRHLSAMAAALVPTTGSAAQAGNSLRTMISRLQAPTRDTIDVLEKMGISVMSNEWLGKTATQKIEFMADKFLKLSSANQTLVSSVVASRWQVNRFARLMEDIGSKTGYYQKALDATSDTAKANGDITRQQAVYWRELSTVLDSNPKKFEILTNTIKNSLTSAILPLLPAISSVISSISIMATQFSELDPQTRKYIVFGLAFLAITGPIVRLTGAWVLLLSQVGKGFFYAGKGLVWFVRNASVGIFKLLQMMLGNLIGGSTVWTTTWGKAEMGRVQATNMANQAIIISNETAAGASAGAAGAAGSAWVRSAWAAWVAWNAFLDSFGIGMGAAAATAAGSQAAIPAAAAPMAALTAGIWTSEVTTVATTQAIGMGAAASSQALVPIAAAGAASATVSIWARALTVMRALFTRVGVILMTAVEGAVASVAMALGIPFWTAAAIIAAAVAAIIVILDDDLRQNAIDIFQAIGRGIVALPRIFGDALAAVARVVAGWIRQIVDLLSYLNPFQRHSPSLVDSVRAGVATILDHYSSLKRIGPMLMGAARAHEAFNAAVAATQAGFAATERGRQREVVAEVAPHAVPSFDALGGQVDALKSVLPGMAAIIDAQNTVTARWQETVDRLNASLERETAVLDDLQAQLSAVESAMDEAQTALTDLGNVNLPGMQAMEDQIFANEQAQKQLRLEILRMEEAGQSVDSLRDKMAALAGWIELLGGEREDLRLAGAGSDVLAVYDQEIAALEAQRQAMQEQGDAVADIEKSLADLQRQAEILDLEKSLSFDGPLREIDQMIDGLNEMPFDDIVAEIQKQKSILATLQPQYDTLTAAVKRQQAVVDAITREHDAANAELERQKDIASQLEQAYSDIEAQIREMESSMESFASAARSARDASAGSTAEQLFDAGVGADFETPIGDNLLGAEGGLADIEAFNAELQKELEKVMADMGGVDIFGGIKNQFDGFVNFVKDWGRILGPALLGGLAAMLLPFVGWWAVPLGLLIGALWKWGPAIWDAIRGAWDWAWKQFGPYVETAMGWLDTAWDALWSFMGRVISFAWNNIIKPILSGLWNFIKNVIMPVFEALGAAIAWVWNNIIAPAISWAWENVIKPVFQALWGFIDGYVRPVFELLGAVVIIVFTLIWRAIEWAWNNILPVLGMVLSWIGPILVGAFNILATVVGVVFAAIWTAIQWAWGNVIQPVFSAIWGFITNTLGPVFNWLWNNVISPVMTGIGNAISWAWENVIQPVFTAIDTAIRGPISTAFTWLRDNVIQPVWNGIVGIIRGAWNLIAGILEAGINGLITIFNFLAQGVNNIASALNIDVKVSKMEKVKFTSEVGSGNGMSMGSQMATGGIIPPAPQGGFAGTQARAIVAEGSRIHREFVIPTDPKYRQRAMGLFGMLAEDLGMVPQMASGGIIPDIPDIPNVGDVAVDWGGKAARAAAALAEMVAKVASGMGGAGVDMFKKAATWTKDKVVGWANDHISNALESAKDFLLEGRGFEGTVARAKNRELGQQMAAERGWTGGQWSALDKLIMGESGWNNTAQNPTSTAYGIFQFLNSTWGAYGFQKTSDPRTQILAGYKYIASRYGTPMNAYNTWLSRSPHWYASGGILGDIPELANGGSFIARRQSGGILMRVGEGRTDERVQVTPLRSGDDGGKKEYHFYGDLSFPNIKSGDDAEEFLRNLENLVG